MISVQLMGAVGVSQCRTMNVLIIELHAENQILDAIAQNKERVLFIREKFEASKFIIFWMILQ